MRVQECPDGLLLESAGRPLAHYVLRPDVPAEQAPKPYLHPVYTLDGALVTDFQPDDHSWHHGLQFAIPKVGPHNLWGGATYLGTEKGYQPAQDHGSITHVQTRVDGRDGRASLRQGLTWHGAGQQALLKEVRELEFTEEPDVQGWSLNFRTALTNGSTQTLTLETPAQRGKIDGGYGGLFLRLARGMQVTEVVGPDGPAESGVASPWLVLRCRSAYGRELTLGLAHLNEWGPGRQHWIVRRDKFPAVGWAFAYDGVGLRPGETLSLGHRIVIADGSPPLDALRAGLPPQT